MKYKSILAAVLLAISCTPMFSANALDPQDNAYFVTQSDVTATSASAQALPANIARRYLVIQNKSSSVNVYVKFGTAHTGTEGIQILPGGYYEPNKPLLNQVYLVTASSTALVSIIEGI